jgi:hypothetical protein
MSLQVLLPHELLQKERAINTLKQRVMHNQYWYEARDIKLLGFNTLSTETQQTRERDVTTIER